MLAAADCLGIIPDPEITMQHLDASMEFLAIASDGVFEFLPSQSVVEMVRVVVMMESPADRPTRMACPGEPVG